RSTPSPTSASAAGPSPAMTARVPALTRSALLVSDPARDDGYGGGEAGQLIIGAGERGGPGGDQVGRRAGHEGASGLAAEEPRSRDGVEAQRFVPADRVLRAKDAGRSGARGHAADRAERAQRPDRVVGARADPGAGVDKAAPREQRRGPVLAPGGEEGRRQPVEQRLLD